MTTYSAITSGQTDAESPFDTTLADQYKNNVLAIQEGDGTAPAIAMAALASYPFTQTDIGASAVGQGELKSTTASQSTSVGASAYGAFDPTGGDYTACWYMGQNTDAPSGGGIFVNGHNTTYTARVSVYNPGGSSATAYLYSRYAQASPPWDLGYGEIPLFIYALLDKTTQEVLGTYAAQDPPWAYHGPHNLHPVEGIIQKHLGLWGQDIGALLQTDRQATIAKLTQGKVIKNDKKVFSTLRKNLAFTMDEKNIDMDIAPHLFIEFDPAKHIVVMLDPAGPLTEEIALTEEFTGLDFNVSNLLHGNYFSIDNTELPVNVTPSGVLTVGYSWKKTG